MPQSDPVFWRTFARRYEMKSRPGSYLIFALGAGMDLCWLQAWTAFILHAIFKYNAPLLFVFFIYGCGMITNFFCYFRQRIRLQVFVIKLIAFLASILIATHFFLFYYNGNAAPLSLSQLFNCHKSFEDWALTLTIALVAGAIWKRSTIHMVKPLNPENVYHRFDLGIAALFSLMVLKLLLSARFGVTIVYPDLKTLFPPFFLSGLLAIGLMLSAEKENRQYVSGFQKIGVVLSFSVVTFCGGLGLVFLFRSQLTASAEVLSGVLKKAGPPLEGAIVWVARLLWASKRSYESPASSATVGQNAYGSLITDGSVETGWLTAAIKWGTTALVALMLLVSVYLLIRYLIRFLLAKTNSVNPRSSGSFDFRRCLIRLKAIMSRFLNRIVVLAQGIRSGADLFKALVLWGRRSGIPYKRTDTPMEYGTRLAASFPVLDYEINMIVNLVQQEIYGEIKLNASQIAAGKKAKKRLHHPVFWKNRIKTWVFSPGK